jgi:ubiquinone/menaquinone biosynthesis C-methylase UbiE
MFDGAAATYDQWYTTATGRVVETVEWQCALDLMDLTPGMHVLDAGCGTGRLAKVMAEKGCRVTGVDQSPGMLAEARKRLAEQAEVTLIEGDLEVLPFDANHFDLVVSMATFAFLEEPEAVLDELFRVVKPGGRVVVGIITAEGAWGQLYKSRAFREDPVFSRARFLRPEDLARYHENEWIQTSGCLYLGPGEEPFTVEADRALSGERKAGFACVAWEKERR